MSVAEHTIDSMLPPEALARQRTRAGVASRIAVMVLDAAIVAAAMVIAYVALASARFVWRPARFQWPQISWPAAVAIGSVLAIVYLTVGWSSTGKTWGKRILGLRLLGSGGQPPGVPVALLRAALCVFFPVGLLWSAVSGRNASVQDLICRTSVIYDWRSRKPS